MNKLYKERYDKFIKHRLENPLFKTVGGIYVENHHIKPRSFFPKNTPKKIVDKNNTVYLTAREHFIAHCLLAKMYKVGSVKWHKSQDAITATKIKSKTHKDRYVNSRLYEHIKTTHYKQVNKENEDKCLIIITEICDWIDENNRVPKHRAKNKIEAKMGRKINSLRQAKKGKISVNFHQSYQDLATSRGYSNLFDIINNEVLQLNEINEICDWMDINNRKPKRSYKDDIENKLSTKINSLRQAKKGNGKYVFNESYQKLAESRGYPDLLNTNNPESEMLIKINDICDWMDINNTTPKGNSKDIIEKTMGRKLNSIRQAKKDNGSYNFHQSYQVLVESRGYPKLFHTSEEITLEYINEICDWIVKYSGRIPNRYSTDTTEKKMGYKIDRLKQAKKGKNNTVFHQSFQELIEHRGYPKLF